MLIEKFSQCISTYRKKKKKILVKVPGIKSVRKVGEDKNLIYLLYNYWIRPTNHHSTLQSNVMQYKFDYLKNLTRELSKLTQYPQSNSFDQYLVTPIYRNMNLIAYFTVQLLSVPILCKRLRKVYYNEYEPKVGWSSLER